MNTFLKVVLIGFPNFYICFHFVCKESTALALARFSGLASFSCFIKFINIALTTKPSLTQRRKRVIKFLIISPFWWTSYRFMNLNSGILDFRSSFLIITLILFLFQYSIFKSGMNLIFIHHFRNVKFLCKITIEKLFIRKVIFRAFFLLFHF